MIKIFGHKSPDTDTIGSAILWAWYQNTHTTNKAEAFALGELNKETRFVLKKWNVAEPTLLEDISAGDDVMIVDTNNPEELFSNISDANVLQIIDHHRLVGGISTKNPPHVTLRPLACTATVIFDLITEHVAAEHEFLHVGVASPAERVKKIIEIIPREMLGVMLSCILSDTLAFRSPTTTPHDKTVAENIALALELDIVGYADELFAAKSDISDFTDAGLVHLDSKKTDVGTKKVRVSVVETTNPAQVLARREGIISAIKAIMTEETGLDGILFFIVDILKEESTVFTYDVFTQSMISASFGVDAVGDTVVLPGVVSRKKQIVPALKIGE